MSIPTANEYTGGSNAGARDGVVAVGGSPQDAVEARISDNNKTVALAQIDAQMFALQQASIDREMTLSAKLELGIEKFDTNLQIAKLDFFQQMNAEQNSHVEALAVLSVGHPGAMNLPSVDLPEPEVS